MKKILDNYITELPDGRFWIDVRDGSGKRLRRYFLRLDEARTFVRTTLLAREDTNQERQGMKRRRRRSADAVAEFREEKEFLRPATSKRYRSILEWFETFLHDHRITYLDQFDADKHGNELRRLLLAPRKDPKRATERILVATPRTVNLYLQVIRGLFQREVKNRNLSFNPLANVRNIPLQQKAPEYYSEADLAAFFAQSMPKAYRRAFLGLLLTGMRFDELANLRWVDVDFEKRVVSVTAHGTFQPKTQNALRTIPMGETLHTLLCEIASQPLSSEYPFCSSTGRQLRERHTLFICKQVALKAGIGRAFLHKFRHTFATQLLSRGASLEQLKALLGHSSIKETEMYAHPAAAHLHNVVQLLDGVSKML